MKFIHYILLAAVVLEVSLVIQTVAQAEDEKTPVDSTAAKKPKIKRTIRVRENVPEAPVAPAIPNIHNEGASNKVDITPNITVQLPQQADHEDSADGPQDSEPAKVAQNQPEAKNGSNTEIFSAGDIGNTKITKIGNVGNKEITEIKDVNNEKHHPCPHPHHHEHPQPHHHHHHHPPPHAHQDDKVKIQSPAGTPLFQININGQENELKEQQPRPMVQDFVLPVVSESSLPAGIPSGSLEQLLSNENASGLRPFSAGQLLRQPIILSLAQPQAAFMAPPPPQQPMMMPPFEPFPYQMPYPMPMPMPMMPMWNPYMPSMGPPYPFWEEPHHKRRHHRKGKKEKKEKKEEPTTPIPEITSTTTEAPVVQPKTVVEKLILPEVPTATPKPVQEIEWETVRVPKIRRSS